MRDPELQPGEPRREIKENTRDPFNNLFAYDYRKNTEREMLIFVLVFWHFFLQSNTPLIAQEKVCPNRHTFFFFHCDI